MFQKLIAKIAEELNKSGLPYMVIGGQAVLLYGEPRLTKDIDITLGLGVDQCKKVFDMAHGLGLKLLVDDPTNFVNQFMVLPLLDKETQIKIDLIFSFTPYESEAIKRAKKINFENTEVNFASLEDVVIHKIFSGRARDLEDVKLILLKNKNYDKEYIFKWLAEFDKTLLEDFPKRFKSVLDELK